MVGSFTVLLMILNFKLFLFTHFLSQFLHLCAFFFVLFVKHMMLIRLVCIYIYLHCLLFCWSSNLTRHCVFLTFQKKVTLSFQTIFSFSTSMWFSRPSHLVYGRRGAWGYLIFALGGVGLLLPLVRTCKRRRLGS